MNFPVKFLLTQTKKIFCISWISSLKMLLALFLTRHLLLWWNTQRKKVSTARYFAWDVVDCRSITWNVFFYHCFYCGVFLILSFLLFSVLYFSVKKPTVTVILRGVSGKYVWNAQLNYLNTTQSINILHMQKNLMIVLAVVVLLLLWVCCMSCVIGFFTEFSLTFRSYKKSHTVASLSVSFQRSKKSMAIFHIHTDPLCTPPLFPFC